MTKPSKDSENTSKRSQDMHFNGAVYEPCFDEVRLTKQHQIIKELMLDGKWRSLREISYITGFPECSISAQLRNFRKARFGSYLVDKRRIGNPRSGYWQYCLKEPPEEPLEAGC